MYTKKLATVLALTIFLTVISKAVLSQSTGTIKGTLTDNETGKPVAGAVVSVVGTGLWDMTDDNGNFEIKQVPAGIYTLHISHLEYDSLKMTDIRIETDTTREINVPITKRKTDLKKKLVELMEQRKIDRFEVSNEITFNTGQPCIAKIPVTSLSDLKYPGCAGAVSSGFPPAHGGTSIVNGEAFDAMFFKNYGVNPFVDTEDDHFSTFAVDVDDASYIMARSYLNRGALPPDEAIRTEEFVNHFNYDYESSENEPFRVYFEGAPSEFGQNCRLLKVGIKGRKIKSENRKPANLVFVIDVSGSMAREDRLVLVKKALRLLLDELTEYDRVGIVVYGSRGSVILEPTSLREKNRIITAIEMLQPGGSTYAEEGIRLGYEMAEGCFEEQKINRLILCSDGVANVGQTGAEAILKEIKKYADKGITLSSIGFGMGNYNDILLEKLGNKGNGHYAYVDNLPEAHRIFVENLTGTLQVIARDVKIQMDFNPEAVQSYRLLGYENRDVDDDKFRDDKEDGGEIGSGHEVTALYEIKMHKETSSDNLGTIYIRFKDPDNGNVEEINYPITEKVFSDSFDKSSSNFRLAAVAAEFAEILKNSYWAKGSKLENVLSLAGEIYNETGSEEILELMNLIAKANQFKELAEK